MAFPTLTVVMDQWSLTVDASTYESRPNIYSAPSWSWASISGGILFFNLKTNPPIHESYMIRIIECKTTPITKDPTGQLCAGHIIIRGWLKTLKGLKLESVEVSKYIVHLENRRYPSLAWIDLDQEEQFPETDLHVLPILENHFLPEGMSLETSIRGLVLADTGKQGQYRRVGTFYSNEEGNAMFRRPLYPLDATLDLPIATISLHETMTDVVVHAHPQPQLPLHGTPYSAHGSSGDASPTSSYPDEEQDFTELDDWVEKIIEII
ncbi:heterokaryon incompatibility protein [Paraphaeosphaeria sporulosa]